MEHDSAFAASVLRAEAGIELGHMRTIQQAAKDVKNWRTSAWWLERRAPERFGPRGAGKVNLRQLKAFVGMLIDILCQEFQNEEQRHRILARFDETVTVLAEMIRAAQFDAAAASGQLLLEDTSGLEDESDILESPGDIAVG
jgi:hypothetical protein